MSTLFKARSHSKYGTTIKKVFTKWIDCQLSTSGIKFNTIREMSSCTFLSKIVELFFGVKLSYTTTIVSSDPNDKQKHKLSFIEHTMKYLSDHFDINLNDYSAEDIYNGNEQCLLELIWVIICHVQRIVPEDLLAWVNFRVENNPEVTDFSECFADGLVLIKLLSFILRIETISTDSTNDPRKKLFKLFNKARTDHTILNVIEPGDLMNSSSDKPPIKKNKRIVMLYLSYLRKLDPTYDMESKHSYGSPTTKFITSEKSPVKKRHNVDSETKEKNSTLVSSPNKPLSPRKLNVMIDSTDLENLKNEVNNLRSLLSLKEKTITEKDIIIKDQNKKIKSLETQLITKEDLICSKNVQVRLNDVKLEKSMTALASSLEKIKNMETQYKRDQEKNREEISHLLEQQQNSQKQIESLKHKIQSHTKSNAHLKQIIEEKQTQINVLQSQDETKSTKLKEYELHNENAILLLRKSLVNHNTDHIIPEISEDDTISPSNFESSTRNEHVIKMIENLTNNYSESILNNKKMHETITNLKRKIEDLEHDHENDKKMKSKKVSSTTSLKTKRSKLTEQLEDTNKAKEELIQLVHHNLTKLQNVQELLLGNTNDTIPQTNAKSTPLLSTQKTNILMMKENIPTTNHNHVQLKDDCRKMRKSLSVQTFSNNYAHPRTVNINLPNTNLLLNNLFDKSCVHHNQNDKSSTILNNITNNVHQHQPKTIQQLPVKSIDVELTKEPHTSSSKTRTRRSHSDSSRRVKKSLKRSSTPPHHHLQQPQTQPS
eukprot:TRINITY_DN7759_c0_g1_i1.p1 TRINITY_DN7759_c0_g1~~TRINITY_DN7759_c0_g1_i1.p1  ORF type:complete len:771 (-),score=154.55 TRINITY_DN7759_c0_g1_i1:63-2375(-)